MVDSIFLYPVEGDFDVSAIEHYLEQQPDVLLDPLGTGIYLVCGLPESIEFMRHERLENPSEFPYAVLVTVRPDRINIFQEYGNKIRLRSARSIVRWLLERVRCRVQDEYRNDWTERVAQHGVDILYPERLSD